MKANKQFANQRAALRVLLAGAWLAAGYGPEARANPPAPYNLVFGLVRDSYGTPLASASASILLETPGGVVISAPVLPGYAPGVNYRMAVPMDSATTPDLYLPSALAPEAQFKLFVVLNNATNLPIEMSGNYEALGKPGKAARIDLTLGVDANGDGIPDDWEKAFLAALGLNVPLSSINANSVLAGDGLTLRQEYLYGTYPFNPSHPCLVSFAGFNGAAPILEFPTMTGRYYSVLGSSDAVNWSTVSFLLSTDAPSSPPHNYYYSPGIATLQVFVVPSAESAPTQFYRILVQ
jgi:hypothetical protein